MAHPVHGRVVLTATPPFDEARRYDQAAVRAYRAGLASPDRPSFGAALGSGDTQAYLLEDGIPHAVVGRVEVTTFAPAGRHGVLQVFRARTPRAPVDAVWTGAPRLARPAYAQLTEGGPLPAVRSTPVAGRRGALRWILDVNVGAAAAVRLPDAAAPTVAAAVALAADLPDALAEAEALYERAPELLETELRSRRLMRARNRQHPNLGRALAYALDCSASSASGAIAVLADHEILPLVWTRDAYYVCRLLMETRGDKALDTVRGFLRWLFEVAERPGGWWPRSALANGRAKDLAFQLDQQLYPVLLLADYTRLVGDEGPRALYAAQATGVCHALLGRRTSFGLISTTENPADDPLSAPYHFSSHVLLWRVLQVLGRAADAHAIRDAVRQHFTVDARFAYAVAGPGGSGARHYHDANDLPTVFAPAWGFCDADDPVWRATVDFAWSPRNEAFFPGPFGGLGSLHTPHPWPLGDLQALLIARLCGDAARSAQAEERLDAVTTWDGLLPEAYDERTGAVASRHWFAWPVALRALASEPAFVAP